MTNRIERQARAFETALWYCYHYGLNWKDHIEPKIENRQITAYHITDETYSTTVATVHI